MFRSKIQSKDKKKNKKIKSKQEKQKIHQKNEIKINPEQLETISIS